MHILEESWYGNINPAERPFQKQRGFDKAFRMPTKNEEKLLETLNEREKELFDKFKACYIFKNENGMSLITYITNYKLSEAAKMLLTCSKNVKSVVSSCGFNSVIYFQRIFKEAFGVTSKHFQDNFKW